MNKKEFLNEWTHFFSTINHGASFFDARAIRFANEFIIKLNEVIENETKRKD